MNQQIVHHDTWHMLSRTLTRQINKGLTKYGVVLKTWNGRDAGIDAMEELVDAFQYVVQLWLENQDLQKQVKELEDTIESLSSGRTSLP